MADYDLAIIGGGINGASIARDAAGRGLRMLLVKPSDSRLRHVVGLDQTGARRLALPRARRLQAGARGARRARTADPHLAPHVIRPLRIVLPAYPGPRSALGSAVRAFPLRSAERARDPAGHAARSTSPTTAMGEPLKRRFRYGFEYSDRGSTTARLVVLNALDAAERGARSVPHPADARRARGQAAAHPQRRRPPRGRPPGARQRRRALGRSVAESVCGCRAGRKCGWSRVATSSCGGCSITTAATSSRTPTGDRLPLPLSRRPRRGAAR